MTRVPLDRRSTSRLAVGFVGTVILPVTLLMIPLCYCIVRFGNAFGDFLGHLLFF